MSEHEPIVNPDSFGYAHCTKCGARVGSYSYTQPCTIKDEKPNDFGTTDALTEAIRESAFDRMDRLYKKK